MKKAKIIHILPNFAIGGAERMAVHLMQNLDRSRFEVGAISMYDRVGSELDIMLDQSGIPVWYLGKKRGFDPRMYLRIDGVICRFRPNVIHTHLYVLRYALPSLLLRGVRGKVHTLHSLAEKEVGVPGKLVHHLGFRLGVVPVAIASEVACSLKRVYGITNAPLIPNGIPVQVYSAPRMLRTEWRKKEGIGDEEVIFVSVANLTRQKNHQLLLRAFANIVNVWKKGQLILVGDGEKRLDLELQAKALGLYKRVRFLGVRSDIPAILSACDVFVFSSSWEGNPLAVMEAMAAGKPVVATAVGGVPELVVDGVTGILVPAGDVAAFTAALSVLLNDASMRERMGSAAFIRAEKQFCVKVMTKSYANLYEHLLFQR